MTGSEFGKRAIGFGGPDRVPLEFPKFGLTDFYGFISHLPPEEAGYSWRGEGRKKDEWGCVWQRPSKESGIINEGLVVEQPLAGASLRELRSYAFPDARRRDRYNEVERDLAKGEAEEKFIWYGDFYTLFERCWALRGMDRVFIDLYENKEFIHELLERITDFRIGVLENLKPYAGRIHGYHMGDDWGTQEAPFIGPCLFREFFKPRYKKIMDYAHSLGMCVRCHSDGKINDLIQEFIDIGLDVIEINSPRTLGIDEISKRFRGKICFEVCVDIQKTLPRGNKEEIESEVKELIEKWGTEKGGIIALDYPDYRAIGISEKQARMAMDAFWEYGRYRGASPRDGAMS